MNDYKKFLRGEYKTAIDEINSPKVNCVHKEHHKEFHKEEWIDCPTNNCTIRNGDCIIHEGDRQRSVRYKNQIKELYETY